MLGSLNIWREFSKHWNEILLDIGKKLESLIYISVKKLQFIEFHEHTPRKLHQKALFSVQFVIWFQNSSYSKFLEWCSPALTNQVAKFTICAIICSHPRNKKAAKESKLSLRYNAAGCNQYNRQHNRFISQTIMRTSDNEPVCWAHSTFANLNRAFAGICTSRPPPTPPSSGSKSILFCPWSDRITPYNDSVPVAVWHCVFCWNGCSNLSDETISRLLFYQISQDIMQKAGAVLVVYLCVCDCVCWGLYIPCVRILPGRGIWFQIGSNTFWMREGLTGNKGSSQCSFEVI